MKEYTVIALSVGGHSNKVFSVGDTVTEADFEGGDIPRLIEAKFIKEKEPTKATKK